MPLLFAKGGKKSITIFGRLKRSPVVSDFLYELNA
jgi:hypothetical protein